MGGGGGATVYAAAKGGVLTFTKALANELSSHNILVNNIAPGLIETPFHKDTPQTVMDNLSQKTPVGRNAKPVEIAHAAVYLTSDESNFYTGATLDCNGGLYMV